MFSIDFTMLDLVSDCLRPAIHGGGDSGGMVGVLDALLNAIQNGLESDSKWNPIAGMEVLGSNVHPVLVHFPIAFLLAFLIFEVLGLIKRQASYREFASGLLYLGAFGAVIAAGAGLYAAGTVPHGEVVHEIMEWHERVGLTVAFLSVAVAIWRFVAGPPLGTMEKVLHLSLSSMIGICIFLGADMGGLMVYQYGVGVKSLQSLQDPHQHRVDGNNQNLKDQTTTAPVVDTGVVEQQISPNGGLPAPVVVPEHHHHHHHHNHPEHHH